MGRKTRTLTLFVGIALAVGTTMAGPLGAVTPPPITAVGTVSCSVKATLSFKPALSGVPGHIVVPTTVTLASTLFGCTSTGNATNITGGTSKVSHISDTNDCLAMLTGAPTTQSGLLKWKVPLGTPKVAPSTIEFTSATRNDGPPITIDSSGSSIAGSFTGDVANAHSLIKETTDLIIKKCLSLTGLTAIHIISPLGLPGSNFALGTPPV